MARFQAYLARVAEADPSGWSDLERLAFWVNAYNALVVNAVLVNWPVQRVTDVPGFFDAARYRAAGEDLTLNDIENTKIREAFHQPLIHFALVCAARSCPPLRNEVYLPERIIEQMTEQAQQFVPTSTRLDREQHQVHASSIFDWFGGDFAVADAGGSVREFIANRFSGDDAAFVRDETTTIAYDDYDWTLNQP
jgi:hypothetical protein